MPASLGGLVNARTWRARNKLVHYIPESSRDACNMLPALLVHRKYWDITVPLWRCLCRVGKRVYMWKSCNVKEHVWPISSTSLSHEQQQKMWWGGSWWDKAFRISFVKIPLSLRMVVLQAGWDELPMSLVCPLCLLQKPWIFAVSSRSTVISSWPEPDVRSICRRKQSGCFLKITTVIWKKELIFFCYI